jgi:purine nucleosidase
MTSTNPFYLDCDTGIDDALALAYLLAAPTADVVGIGTVSGNVSAAVGARNTLDLLQLAGHAHIPVALGAHDPLVGSFGGGRRGCMAGTGSARLRSKRPLLPLRRSPPRKCWCGWPARMPAN